MRVEVAGESALIIYFGEHGQPGVAAAVASAAEQLREELGYRLIDLVPSYASLLVLYDPFRTDHLEVRQLIDRVLQRIDGGDETEGRLVTLPVYYGTDAGLDLDSLAERVGLSVEDVVALHQAGEYRVYAIGFAPGFAYLGDVDERIACPRLATPRQRVPRGAVGIADRQTAIYPAVSPGGWNLIGRCPQRMFDPNAEPTMPVQVGDRVRFESISRDEFFALGGSLDDE
ncbi:5-oxoprolinase subunit PxpB [Marinobacterium stanieri]|uniref:Sensor histidine kinase inhibitor, KipI family n=1 Tax=Marinobacterium stanieri TaxID=49186 RepID=A0A1N6ND68_9GAMM|nr:5-oxoprolinase subunit PxpB [Marinobacterium stanieri]SIP89992.1 sensor histidine kinase inhibitor, KipI family [Marinobacterium stanieri]